MRKFFWLRIERPFNVHINETSDAEKYDSLDKSLSCSKLRYGFKYQFEKVNRLKDIELDEIKDKKCLNRVDVKRYIEGLDRGFLIRLWYIN